MKFQDKNLKEKQEFYKERQKLFDAVKSAREGNFPVITFKGERYKLLIPEKHFPYIENKRDGKAVIFSKLYKSHTLVDWYYGNKSGFRWCSETNKYIKGNYSKILCYAEKVN